MGKILQCYALKDAQRGPERALKSKKIIDRNSLSRSMHQVNQLVLVPEKEKVVTNVSITGTDCMFHAPGLDKVQSILKDRGGRGHSRPGLQIDGPHGDYQISMTAGPGMKRQPRGPL